MNSLKLYTCCLFFLISCNATAETSRFLSVDNLLENGYTMLSGEQLQTIMREHVIEVVDIETKAISISKKGKSPVGMEREFVEVKGDKPRSVLDAQLLARAPMLEGDIKRKVVGDELISTDGLRTYHYRLYRKQQKIYAVRDIDHGNVFLEVKIK